MIVQAIEIADSRRDVVLPPDAKSLQELTEEAIEEVERRKARESESKIIELTRNT